MFPSRLLRPSINKWAAFTATGISSTIAYGVRELWNQPLQDAKRLFSPSILLSNTNELGLKEEKVEIKEEKVEIKEEKVEIKEEITIVKTPSPEPIPSPQPEIPEPVPVKVITPAPVPVVPVVKVVEPKPVEVPKVKERPKVTTPPSTPKAPAKKPVSVKPKPTPKPPTPKKPKPQPETYQIDQTWLSSSTHHSMAYKYRDYLLLVQKNHPAWQTKSTRLKTMARQSGEKKFWTYWKGYVEEKYLTSLFVHGFCKEALSYSEYGTFWTLGMSKQYMDFLWSMCGRDDKSKPKEWWYRD